MTKRRRIRQLEALLRIEREQSATVIGSHRYWREEAMRARAENAQLRAEIKALHERSLAELVREAHARTVRRFTRAELAEEEAV